MADCPACSHQVTTTDAFCPACGTALPRATTRLPTGGSPLFSDVALDSSRSSAPRFLPGTVLAERYRVVTIIGSGGMGEVYRADDLELDQSVALKFLPASVALNPGAVARFHAEVRIARQVSHPNVCRVHDIGQVGGRVCLVTRECRSSISE